MTLQEAIKFGGRLQEGGNVLAFPYKKPPPTEVDGYIRDETDVNIFTKIWIPCRHRTAKQTCLPCPGKRFVAWCKIKDIQVDQGICNACDIQPK